MPRTSPSALAGPPLTGDQLRDFDREHLWHPYASISDPAPAYVVVSADGVRLQLDDGRAVVDAMSSWWCAIHGYRHPVLDEAVRAQLTTMAHVMFGGLTHSPAVELARRLVAITPDGVDRVFLADSGSVSVEVAVKIVLQHARGTGRPRRHRMLTVRGGYHGDTFAAMSVCDPVGGMHTMFTDVLMHQVHAPRPPSGLDADVSTWAGDVRALARRHQDEIAGIVVEPVLQGAGGMHIYPPGCLQVLREVADEHGFLLVFDEIATGFGRTGAMFAAEHAGVRPDVMCVGKALTGGYLTLSAVVVTADVAGAVGSSESGVLMHGPTFMANPLACAVAAASLDLLAEGSWREQVARIGRGLAAGLEPLRSHVGVADVRTLGAVGVVQLDRPVDVRRATAAALDAGVWIRPFRDLVYTMPPYVTDDDDVRRICTGLTAAVVAATS
ncbi:MAG: adenosylmethionine--8-amino-7-oxononanoate transaminase [Nocardioidaceae bacterium]